MKKLIADLTSKKGQQGQALVLIALAFIGIAAFIGLTIDSGILFSNVGHLRRAVDSASLAAANQFREGRTPAELTDSAREFLVLNGLEPSSVIAKVCDFSPPSPYHDPNLCPTGGETARKYVRVEAELPVYFAFLPIIGWTSTTIRADAISEAASIDLVLVIDASPSMAYGLCNDTIDNDGDGAIDKDDCPKAAGGTAVVGDPESWVPTCNAATDASGPDPSDPNQCHPFEEVRDAAKDLVRRMYFPYDRISIVTFAQKAAVVLELETCAGAATPALMEACGLNALDSLRVEQDPPLSECPGWEPDPSGCTSTATGDGMKHAGGRFCLDDGPPAAAAGNGLCERTEMREEAVWIVIVVSDGAANAGLRSESPDIWYCPTNTHKAPAGSGPPYCRRGDTSSNRHWTDADAEYDADDYARAMADFVGCEDDPTFFVPGGICSKTTPLGGQRATIFSIGMGDLMINNTEGNPDAGEQLMRYMAAAGDDFNPDTDPCAGVPKGNSCGNYYFVDTPDKLKPVFEAIASRIFTRITH